LTHALLTRVSKGDVRWEIEGSKKVLEQITGKKVEWLCYPRGYYNEGILKMVKKVGYKYARTVKFKDGETDFEKGGIHLSYPRIEYLGKDPFEVARESEMRHYWFHCFEVIKFSLWGQIGDFLKWYKNNRKETK